MIVRVLKKRLLKRRPRIGYFKEFLPTPVCIFLSMFFAMTFQFNGGVFLPISYQMSSELGCIQQHVTMAGYASFIGMTIIFPILIRLKCRFMTRHILLAVCPVLMACNLITLHTPSLPLQIAVCFVSGFFRMWGTFECFSNMRLSVTPSGNFSVFYPVIYVIVLESIQLSGLVAIHLTDWANWQYMHWFVMGLLAVVWVCVFVLTRPYRAMKKVPLYGIDWIGAALWVVVLFSIVYICIYGEYFDWLDSADTCLQCDSRSGVAGQYQPDAHFAPSVYRAESIPLPPFSHHLVPVSDVVPFSCHFIGFAEPVYVVYPEV